MYSEEVELTLECAEKMKNHLMRVLERKSDLRLENQLRYINQLIAEGQSMELASVA